MADETNPEEQDDPIVAEVRAARRQLLEKYGGIEGYLRYLREVHAQRREAAELGKSA